MDLIQKHCISCEGDTKPMDGATAVEYLKHVPDWSLRDGGSIVREMKFKDFKSAISFVNRMAKVAERESHHPDIYIFYNTVRFELSTHAIGGLSEDDFIIATKINGLIPLG